MASLGHDVVEATPPYPIDAMQTVMRVCMPVSMAADVDARLAELGRPLRDDDLEPFTHVLYGVAKGLSGTDVVIALQAVERIGQEVGRFFDGDTLLLTPTIAAPVPPLGHLDTTNVESMYGNASTYSATDERREHDRATGDLAAARGRHRKPPDRYPTRGRVRP